MKLAPSTTQKGFTLVEIAIVLVIIGLLLGGVLKGQELVENAKAKQIVNDLQNTAAAVNSYRDRYGKLPGDDNKANAALRGWADAVLGNGDGKLADKSCCTAVAGENTYFWQHLRYAGFIKGDAAGGTPGSLGQALPVNAYDGVIGVANNFNSASAVGYGLGLPGRSIICASNLPAKGANQVDVNLDDGNGSTGTVRAMASATEPTDWNGTAAFIEGTDYIVCKSLL